MKFKKLNDNSVRCLISKEEMYDMGMDIDALIEDRAKAEEFLRDIVDQARDEVGFEAVGNAFNVQLSIMPEGDISLMITEDDNAKLRNMLAQFKDRIKEFKEIASKNQVDTHVSQENEQPEGEKTSVAGKYIEVPLFARFLDLDACMRLSKILCQLGEVPSGLYKYREEYYMWLDLSQMYDGTAEAILSISEYSEDLFPKGNGSDVVEEHGQLMIAQDAVDFLASL